MNIITYKEYSKDWNGRRNNMEEVKKKLQESIDSCENFGQLSSTLAFHSNYLGAMDYESNVRYKEVTDRIMKAYFKKQKL